MLMSFRSVMFRPRCCCGGGGAVWPCGAGFDWDSGVDASVGGGESGGAGPFAVRAGAWRLWLLGMKARVKVGLHVERRHVDRPGNVEDRRVRFQSLDFGFVWIDGDDRVTLLTKGTQRSIAELASIARRADHRDDLSHDPSLTAERAELAEKPL